ncbi:MAG: alkaline phosphatase family protein, partial [Acidobacteriota bacterium]
MRKWKARLLVLSLCGLLPCAGAMGEKPGRIIVLGFDGVDAGVVEGMLAAGRLPNLAALKARGAYSPLTPTVPAQTPVSWSTFATGLDPGGHEIFDFLKRDPKNRVPTFAVAEEISVPFLFGKSNPVVLGLGVAVVFLLAGALLFFFRRRAAIPAVIGLTGLALGAGAFYAVRQWVPSERPGVHNNRRGATFWADEGAGPATVIRMPVTFPPERLPGGRQLSGLGVPDISGRIGKPFYFTSDPFFAPREGNDFSVEVVKLESNTGRQTTKISGPPGKPFGREGWIEIPLTLTVASSRDRLDIDLAGEHASLKVGDWSPWLSMPFRVNPLVTVHGYGRFRLEKLDPEIALYLSPVQFDPERLPSGFDLSSPSRFAPHLVRDFGRFKTMGWAIDTWSIQSGTLSEDAFLEDVATTVAQDRKILTRLLADTDRLLVHYFEFPDRVAHVFWRFRDPQHPAYDAALAKKYGDAVEKSYETVDAIVGEAAKALGPSDVLIVLSDHGFATWRRSVNYNSWLVEAGYLVLTGGASRKSLEALFSRGQFWENVDW